ncbi:short chain dehydrogenase [Psychromonas aquimarina]|uniref:short chain dehydrogenase n=1 Tax=Psychromonas aquimarina TaxID=444919 RepID=UPI000406A1A8|nr:short chain dehydrogenase [Psychromonas aquimarina]
MKILIIGATGTIGKAAAKLLSEKHEIVAAGYSDGDVKVDLGNPESIKAMFEQVGEVDAVVCSAGLANFAPLALHSDQDFELALNNKLMGQINLFRIGQNYITQQGSITLTSGILSRQPMPGSASISMVNGALESFVKAAALELEQLRINVVAPGFVKETMVMMGMDPSSGISAADTAKVYAVAVNGNMHGETLDVIDYV